MLFVILVLKSKRVDLGEVQEQVRIRISSFQVTTQKILQFRGVSNNSLESICTLK